MKELYSVEILNTYLNQFTSTQQEDNKVKEQIDIITKLINKINSLSESQFSNIISKKKITINNVPCYYDYIKDSNSYLLMAVDTYKKYKLFPTEQQYNIISKNRKDVPLEKIKQILKKYHNMLESGGRNKSGGIVNRINRSFGLAEKFISCDSLKELGYTKNNLLQILNNSLQIRKDMIGSSQKQNFYVWYNVWYATFDNLIQFETQDYDITGNIYQGFWNLLEGINKLDNLMVSFIKQLSKKFNV